VTGRYPLPVGGRTLADDLRDDLTQCELLVSRIGHAAGQAPPTASAAPITGDAKTDGLTLLRLLDSVADGLERMEQRGTDLRAERVRFENVLLQLNSRDRAFVSQIGGTLQAERPVDARWWWHLNEQVAAKRRRRLKRVVGTTLIALVLVAVLYVLYDRLLAAPPNVRKAVSAVFQGEQAVSEGNLQQAIEQFEKAVELDPENSEALLWLGVLYQNVNDTERAKTAFEEARTHLSSDVDFLLERGLLFLTLGDNESARQDAQAAIDLSPGQPEGYFLLGNVAEQMGDLELAYNAFDRTSQLAAETGQVTLQATARMRLANVLQRLMVAPQQ
jgi:tetratricopeptide (TPR) repeat protein